MKPPRRHIPLSTKLAATLLQMKRVDENGKLVPVITYEESKTMTAKQIIARFEFDHYPIRKIDGGPDAPWNLRPLAKLDHKKKTNEIDKPQIAKQRRIRGETCNGPKRKIPARVNPWPKGRAFERRAGR